MNQLLEECLKIPEPENIAKIIYFLYKDEFICTSIKKKTWKQKQDDDSFVNIEEGYILFNRISSDINRYFQKFQIDIEESIIKLKKQNNNIETNEEIKVLVSKVKQCELLFKRLKNYTFKIKVMKESSMLFYKKI